MAEYGNDTIVTNSSTQYHIYGGAADDTINLRFSGTISQYRKGHHARGDTDGSINRGEDVFNFRDVDSVVTGGVVVGRIEDFDYSRDTIEIDGDELDLNNLNAYNSVSDHTVSIVAYNGTYDDVGSYDQQWILIETSAGGVIFYSLEGARVDIDGTGGSNGDNQEDHFIPEASIPQNFSNLSVVNYIDQQNYVPDGFSLSGSGLIINDDDDREVGDGEDNDSLPDLHVSTAIVGSVHADLIAGGLNGDTIQSVGGDDTIWGGSGHDVINSGSGIDLVFGGSGDDTISGGTGNDALNGDEGDDLIYGNDGDDSVNGGNGDDVIQGGIGNDHLRGDNGKDVIRGGNGSDIVTGNAGQDRLYGNGGADTLNGDGGSDSLYGAQGNDTLNGGDGWDILDGGTGDDVLSGGLLGDTLTGGDGADKFVFDSGNDSITDFQDDIDTIEINSSVWGGGSKSVQEVLDYASVVNGDVIFDFGGGSSLKIEGFTNISALSDDLVIA